MDGSVGAIQNDVGSERDLSDDLEVGMRGLKGARRCKIVSIRMGSERARNEEDGGEKEGRRTNRKD